MCGITFIISKNKINIIQNLLNSLELIQNRGYDSMGVCYFDNSTNNYIIEKNASTYNKDCYDLLKNKLLNNNIFSHVGLGHTRWATHGGKTDINSHPHISEKGNIILVHNGIINNFEDLKLKLLNNGIKFKSETDSEVIANLIEYYLLYMGNTIEEAIQNTINELEGTWALVIIYTKELDTYYVTRKGSPLLLGNNENYIICTSETNGFVCLVNNYIPLKDNTIVKINKNNYEFLCESDGPDYDDEDMKKDFYLKYDVKKVCYEDIINTSKPYPHWMKKEIMEQPESIKKAYNYGGRIENNIVKLGGLDIHKNLLNNVEYILIIGCGTSYNAGLIGENYLKKNKKFKIIKLINACEFSIDDIPNIANKQSILCIFLSQSGETIDVYNCLKICKNEGCITMGIINKVDSLIAREVMCGVYLNAGPEISVASTKSFTSMIVVLALVDLWFSQNNNNYYINSQKIDCLRYLPNSLNNLFNNFKFLRELDILKHLIIEKNINNIFLLGKNNLFSVAHEGSLKIKEVTYLHCEGFSAGSLKHGPFALLDKTNLTILLIDETDNNNYQNLKSTYYEILGRETNIFVITNSLKIIEELNLNENNYCLLYKSDYYNEIIFTIALQYLAYEISIAKNINPDKPRNLAKVVTVE
jgi:glucosamine--fructose-6-phosphate aminotransferase (isomerizing)